jgi:hypothetical protein
MTNKDNNELFFIIGGIIAAIAGVLGVNYIANNKENNQKQGTIPQKSSCNKCPFSN